MLRKILSVGLSLSFIWTSGYTPEVAAAVPVSLATPSHLPQFDLIPPSNLGRIADYFNARSTDAHRPLVILIQDLHAHYGVQKNIAGILEFLSKKLGHGAQSSALPFAIALEGAEGPIDNSILALFPDRKVKLAAADYLMREGELTGADYFTIRHGLATALTGVENERYYAIHRDLFRQTYAQRSALVEQLKGIQKDLSVVAPRALSRRVKNLRHQEAAFEQGELSTEDFISLLISDSQKGGTDALISAGEFKSKFPTLYTFAAQSGIEQNAQARRSRLARLLQPEYSPIAPETLRALTAEFVRTIQPQLTNEEKVNLAVLAKNNSQVSYYQYLRDVIYAHQFFATVPRELAKYLEYLHTSQTMGIGRVTHEARELSFLLKDRSAKTQREKDFVQVEHDLKLLLRLSDLQATEYEVRLFAPHLNKFLALCGALLSSAPSPTSVGEGRDEGQAVAFDEQSLRQLISSSIDFYVMAMLRNAPMVDHTLQLINAGPVAATPVPQNNKPNVAVLITGGFHTQTLTQLLREKNISYLVMSPTVDLISEQDHNLYIQRLMGNRLTEDEVLAQSMQSHSDLSASLSATNTALATPRALGLPVAITTLFVMTLLSYHAGVHQAYTSFIQLLHHYGPAMAPVVQNWIVHHPQGFTDGIKAASSAQINHAAGTGAIIAMFVNWISGRPKIPSTLVQPTKAVAPTLPIHPTDTELAAYNKAMIESRRDRFNRMSYYRGAATPHDALDLHILAYINADGAIVGFQSDRHEGATEISLHIGVPFAFSKPIQVHEAAIVRSQPGPEFARFTKSIEPLRDGRNGPDERVFRIGSATDIWLRRIPESTDLLLTFTDGSTHRLAARNGKAYQVGATQSIAPEWPDDTVSRHHLDLKYVEGQGWLISDHNSNNGTWDTTDGIWSGNKLRSGTWRLVFIQDPSKTSGSLNTLNASNSLAPAFAEAKPLPTPEPSAPKRRRILDDFVPTPESQATMLKEQEKLLKEADAMESEARRRNAKIDRKADLLNQIRQFLDNNKDRGGNRIEWRFYVVRNNQGRLHVVFDLLAKGTTHGGKGFGNVQSHPASDVLMSRLLDRSAGEEVIMDGRTHPEPRAVLGSALRDGPGIPLSDSDFGIHQLVYIPGTKTNFDQFLEVRDTPLNSASSLDASWKEDRTWYQGHHYTGPTGRHARHFSRAVHAKNLTNLRAQPLRTLVVPEAQAMLPQASRPPAANSAPKRKITVSIPSPLRGFLTDKKQNSVTVSAATVGEALDAIIAQNPNLAVYLRSAITGTWAASLKATIGNNPDVIPSASFNTALFSQDETLEIFFPIAGGSGRADYQKRAVSDIEKIDGALRAFGMNDPLRFLVEYRHGWFDSEEMAGLHADKEHLDRQYEAALMLTRLLGYPSIEDLLITAGEKNIPPYPGPWSFESSQRFLTAFIKAVGLEGHLNADAGKWDFTDAQTKKFVGAMASLLDYQEGPVVPGSKVNMSAEEFFRSNYQRNQFYAHFPLPHPFVQQKTFGFETPRFKDSGRPLVSDVVGLKQAGMVYADQHVSEPLKTTFRPNFNTGKLERRSNSESYVSGEIPSPAWHVGNTLAVKIENLKGLVHIQRFHFADNVLTAIDKKPVPLAVLMAEGSQDVETIAQDLGAQHQAYVTVNRVSDFDRRAGKDLENEALIFIAKPLDEHHLDVRISFDKVKQIQSALYAPQENLGPDDLTPIFRSQSEGWSKEDVHAELQTALATAHAKAAQRIADVEAGIAEAMQGANPLDVKAVAVSHEKVARAVQGAQNPRAASKDHVLALLRTAQKTREDKEKQWDRDRDSALEKAAHKAGMSSVQDLKGDWTTSRPQWLLSKQTLENFAGEFVNAYQERVKAYRGDLSDNAVPYLQAALPNLQKSPEEAADYAPAFHAWLEQWRPLPGQTGAQVAERFLGEHLKELQSKAPAAKSASANQAPEKLAEILRDAYKSLKVDHHWAADQQTVVDEFVKNKLSPNKTYTERQLRNFADMFVRGKYESEIKNVEMWTRPYTAFGVAVMIIPFLIYRASPLLMLSLLPYLKPVLIGVFVTAAVWILYNDVFKQRRVNHARREQEYQAVPTVADAENKADKDGASAYVPAPDVAGAPTKEITDDLLHTQA